MSAVAQAAEVSDLLIRIAKSVKDAFGAELRRGEYALALTLEREGLCASVANCDPTSHIHALGVAIANVMDQIELPKPERAALVAALAESVGLMAEINAVKVDG